MSSHPSTIRTRFAPSPTGYLHVGTARTALYNYLFARRHKGSFVLRVEDTDVARNVEGGADEIARMLQWLGLEWSEGYGIGGPHGPYVQSERLDRYHAAVNALIAQGEAYPCYCTAEELERRRRAAEARGLRPGYDGHCRNLSSSQLQAYEAEGRRAAVRFRLPDEGETVVEDLIRGAVTFQNSTLTDFVVMRPSGIPTYLFAAVYDDVDMGITHVIRGEDLLPATPLQVRVFRALGRAEPPLFAHLPLLVGPDRKKLSKRRHQVALEDYRAQGYLPEAMVNYLALLGWGYDETREHFTLADLERLFSIERVSRNPAMFDNQKLEALNAWYIRQLSAEDLAARLQPFMSMAGYPDARLDLLTLAAPLVSERITRLDQGPDMLGFLLMDDVELDPAEAAQVLTDEARAILDAVTKVLRPLEPWTAESIERALRELAAERGLKPRRAFQPIRLAITGRLVSPPLFESIELLGRERSLARLERARSFGALR
ncbi:MAG TPA: glutamate--tRNA ligase [Actinomycetes bacterium]|jgi:glutamyl-tRNA synthetase|nr:glutamate--tRNA ligase [Actinomycetes bacterium]